DNPNLTVDENRLPPGAFVLGCARLEVASNTVNGQTLPSMKADGHADLQSREFSGRADTIKYDEGQNKDQQVSFESTSSGRAAGAATGTVAGLQSGRWGDAKPPKGSSHPAASGKRKSSNKGGGP